MVAKMVSPARTIFRARLGASLAEILPTESIVRVSLETAETSM